ncbi:MAG: hypothetical protein ACXVB9_11800 [Bdellovibrionota bacterium]
MIEGTKPYRGRVSEIKFPETSTTDVVEAPRDSALSPQPKVAASLGRRDWFRSLVPAMGNGLVEILRASNNLKRDIADASRKTE